MRLKYGLPAILAVLLTAASAPAQTISYINFLQFDLQSFRSQATGGIFQDDVDMVADAANLTSIEGNRLFTNFSNLSDPALMGDNILTYSLDQTGNPTAADEFDTGSYLVGWIGKYSQDSDYNFSIFYQRNGAKGMFENLEDLNLGSFSGSSFDAQYSGFTRTTVHDDSTGAVLGDQLSTFDLERYDERTAMNFDLGAARDMSEDMTFGGRFFWENDQLDSFAGGTVEVANRTADSTGTLITNSRSLTEYFGTGEEAYRSREIGVSLDVDYHPWENQDINIRLDVFGSKLVNPSESLSPPSRGGPSYGWWQDGGLRVNLIEQTNFTRIASGTGTAGGSALASDRENTTYSTNGYTPYPNSPSLSGRGFAGGIESIDDDRTGIGFAGKAQWDREWAGGENRAWVGFGRRSLDVDATIVEVSRNGSTFWWNSGAGDREATVTNFEETFTATRDGDMKLTTLEIGTRWNRELNEHVSMGLGGILTRQTWVEEYTQNENYVEIFNGFDDGDAGNNTLYAAAGNNPLYNEEFTRYEENFAIDIEDEMRYTTVRLPVGAQFSFGERWTVNVGAQHTISNYERETTGQADLADNGPGVETYVDVGGAGTPPSPNPEYDTSGNEGDVKLNDKDRNNWTTYWYGLSVMLTDAAQLDINGFFDSHSFDRSTTDGYTGPDFSDSGQLFDVDFFRNLAISLKYIFW